MYAACRGAYGSLYSVFCILKIPDRANFVVHQTLAGNSGRAGPAVLIRFRLACPPEYSLPRIVPRSGLRFEVCWRAKGSWEIIAVENGQDAIAKAQGDEPDLIILDLVMPVMDGLAAARAISKLLPEIPMRMHTSPRIRRLRPPFHSLRGRRCHAGCDRRIRQRSHRR
jgi:CheY-like chemotaxis protein